MVSNMDRRLWTTALGVGLGALIWAGAAHQRLGRLESHERNEAPAIMAASTDILRGVAGMLGVSGAVGPTGAVGPSGPVGPTSRFGKPVPVNVPAKGMSVGSPAGVESDGLLMLWVTCRNDASLTLTGEISTGGPWMPLSRVSMNGNRSVASDSMTLPVPVGARWRVIASGGGGKGFAQTIERGAVWIPLGDVKHGGGDGD
ncbi:MAG: hypothetical protein DRQ55_06415 [Planctomycetota bacterium]|nr:MAG: hypothetical protein DRQ55_06415 [Planctomycetota bacterium]